jgi:hypothetical protein
LVRNIHVMHLCYYTRAELTRYAAVEQIVAVDPDRTSQKCIGSLDGCSVVASVDTSGKTVVRVVGEFNSLINATRESSNSDNGAKDFLTHDGHCVLAVGENGGGDKVTLVTNTLTTKVKSRAFLLANLDVAHDLVKLTLGDLGTLEGIFLERAADLDGLGLFSEEVNELFGNRLVDKDTGSSVAALTMVVEDTSGSMLRSVLKISVGKHDLSRLAAKFELQLLKVGGAGALHDLATSDSGSSESHLGDTAMV